MKRVVLTFGLIAGAILSAMMFATIPFMEQIGNDRGEVIGYTTMVLAFLMVFFGIRSYRDNVAGGTISFGRAFAVGIQITLIACVCYVASWEVIYYKMMPDFADKYAARVVEKTKASGATQAQIAETTRKMDEFKAMYKNPFINVAMTFAEPFPVGLVITLVCAGVLRRRRKAPDADANVLFGTGAS
jgi:hypothetical protein